LHLRNHSYEINTVKVSKPLIHPSVDVFSGAKLKVAKQAHIDKILNKAILLTMFKALSSEYQITNCEKGVANF
jgi:hypothetical protein